MRLKQYLVSLLASLALWACSQNNDKAILDGYFGFNCPAPNAVKYEAWGQNGLSKACVNSGGSYDGSFWAVERGRFFLRGSYKSGEKVGVWEFIDKNGAVTKKDESH